MNAGREMENGAVLARRALGRAIAEHESREGARPEAGGIAPGRVNLIGEHTDYNGGVVLPIAIDRVCAAVGSWRRGRGRSVVYGADIGEAVEWDAKRPLRAAATDGADEENAVRAGSVLSEAAGVVELYARVLGVQLPALRVTVAGSVPIGAGLSSSAALEVAVATVLEGLTGRALPAMHKARLCRAAEHEFGGVPCGLMDQAASVLGREGCALRLDCRDETWGYVAMPPADRAAVLVVNSGVKRALAGGEYAARRASCARACAALGVASLRDATAEAVESAGLDEPDRRRARHVVAEMARTERAARALADGDVTAFGALMNESHESLRRECEVSCAELDAIVEAARACGGVLGARMTGAGFGGCAIALVRPGDAEEAGRRIAAEFAGRFGRVPAWFVTSASAGARALTGAELHAG